jgi:hypothetical protein
MVVYHITYSSCLAQNDFENVRLKKYVVIFGKFVKNWNFNLRKTIYWSNDWVITTNSQHKGVLCIFNYQLLKFYHFEILKPLFLINKYSKKMPIVNHNYK